MITIVMYTKYKLLLYSIIWTMLGLFVSSYFLIVKRPLDIKEMLSVTRKSRTKLHAMPSLDIIATNMNERQKLPRCFDNFKNPCWMEDFPEHFSYNKSFYYNHDCQGQKTVIKQFDILERLTAKRGCTRKHCQRLRCYPYFFLIGAAKSGTTDLHASLQLYHPHFISGSRKESQFWARRRHGITSSRKCPKNEGIAATFADYLDLYDFAAMQIQNISFDTNNTGTFYHPTITGDFTPADMHYLWEWQSMPDKTGLSEPKVTLADELYRIAPRTKIILILRDPVQRFESHTYFVNKNMTPSVLAAKATHFVTEFNQCLQTHSLRHCSYSITSPLVQGIYNVFVKDWLGVFPRNQVLVLHFETYKEDRQVALGEIIRFLGLDPSLSRNQSTVIGRGARLKSKERERMPDATRTLLRDFYKPFNQDLSNMLNDLRFYW